MLTGAGCVEGASFRVCYQNAVLFKKMLSKYNGFASKLCLSCIYKYSYRNAGGVSNPVCSASPCWRFSSVRCVILMCSVSLQKRTYMAKSLRFRSS